MPTPLLHVLLALLPCSLCAQGILKLDKGAQAAKLPVERLAWLSGHWYGEGLGGDCDEFWLPPADNAMQGVFRLLNGGRTTLTEYMCIMETDTATLLRLKHFGRNLEPWEDRERWVTFPLVKAEGTTAWFSGLTYHLRADTLHILLTMHSNGREWTEEFRMMKR